jgi:hypothetical protein
VPARVCYEALEQRGVKYAIRLAANDNLLRDIEELLTRPVGRPSHKPIVWYLAFFLLVLVDLLKRVGEPVTSEYASQLKAGRLT